MTIEADSTELTDTVDRRALVIERHRRAASALSGSARTLRFSSGNRRAIYGAVGLRPRLRDRVFALLGVLVFLVFGVLPAAAAIAYYGFYASDIYESETRFTVRTSAPVMPDREGSMSSIAIPSAKIVQDTQIVTNNVHSRSMIETLDERFDLRGIYSRDEIDRLARLPDDASQEDLEEYWGDMASSDISLPGGIVTLKVRAFSAEEAEALTGEMLEISEALINDLNDRIWRDVSASAESGLEAAAAQLASTRIARRNEQNAQGVLDTDQEAEGVLELLNTVRGELLELESRYKVRSESMRDDTPQQRVLAREIDVKREQVSALQAQIAGASGADEGSDPTLADVAESSNRLEFEQQLAEANFADAVKLAERLRLLSSQQLMYLDPFLAPTLPQEAQYPRRILMSAFGVLGSVVSFLIAFALLQTLRRRFD